VFINKIISKRYNLKLTNKINKLYKNTGRLIAMILFMANSTIKVKNNNINKKEYKNNYNMAKIVKPNYHPLMSTESHL
jgi:hypothetical protein